MKPYELDPGQVYLGRDGSKRTLIRARLGLRAAAAVVEWAPFGPLNGRPRTGGVCFGKSFAAWAVMRLDADGNPFPEPRP